MELSQFVLCSLSCTDTSVQENPSFCLSVSYYKTLGGGGPGGRPIGRPEHQQDSRNKGITQTQGHGSSGIRTHYPSFRKAEDNPRLPSLHHCATVIERLVRY
jgi:hypothetical protein